LALRNGSGGAMTQQSSTERVSKHRQRQKELKRKRLDLYVTDDEKEFLRSALRGRRLAKLN